MTYQVRNGVGNLSPGWAVLSDVLGWVDAEPLLDACVLVCVRSLEGDSVACQLANLVAIAFLTVNSAC